MKTEERLEKLREKCAYAVGALQDGKELDTYLHLMEMGDMIQKEIALESDRGSTQLRLKMSKGNTLMLGVTHTMGTTASVYGIHFPEFDRHQWSPDDLVFDDTWEEDWVMIEIDPDGVVTVQGHGAGYAGEIVKEMEVK